MSTRVVGLFFKSDRSLCAGLAEKIMSASYAPFDVKFVMGENRGTDGGNDFITQWNDAFVGMEFLVSLGGDGTFLRASRAVRELRIPLYGINAGRLGFLASGNPDSAVQDISRILSGDFRLFPRVPLRGTLLREDGKEDELYALNEIAITKGPLSQPVDLRVFANGESLYRFLADGIIVSTPTGSTAYSLSAGGPVVHPEVKCLLVVPICPHSLYPRPVIVGEDETITIEPVGEGGDMIVSGDGHLQLSLKIKDRVRLQLDTENRVNVIKIDDSSYYDVLRSKLGWGGNHISSKC